MANPWHHSVSSVRKWGGVPEDYIEVHTWFDASKEHVADFRHRALRHHTQGIFECERTFGNTITLSTCQRCGKTEENGAHYLAILSLENEFMNDGGENEELAKRISELMEHSHAFAPKRIPVRWIGEQHVQEDLGRIPTLADWLMAIAPEPWMNAARRLSRELEREEAPA